MLKKIIVSMVVLTLVLGIVGCAPKAPTTPTTPTTPDPVAKWKIGIMTGTVAQNEEEFRMAENMIAKYGADKILHQT